MQYNNCPFCGEKYQNPNQTAYKCEHCGKRVFLNSKPTASVLITDGDKVLLGKRSIEPSKGKWDIIGGFLNYGEHPHDGAIREAKEESGLNIEITDYLGAFMDTYGAGEEATMNLCFTAKIIGGVQTPNDDIAELKWFTKSEIPDTELAFDNGKKMLRVLLTT